MKFRLRPWRMSDISSLVEHANNYEIAKYMMDRFPHPYSEHDAKAFIIMAKSDKPTQIFAIEIKGKAVGGIGIHPQPDVMRKNAELGYWLGQQYWGQGIITEAINEITDYAFKTFDISRLFARAFGNNFASQRVLEKTGFLLEARIEKTIFKNGEYLDELIYAVRRKSTAKPKSSKKK